MIPKERIFLKGDVMNALNIQKKTEHKSQAKKEVFFPYYL